LRSGTKPSSSVRWDVPDKKSSANPSNVLLEDIDEVDRDEDIGGGADIGADTWDVRDGVVVDACTVYVVVGVMSAGGVASGWSDEDGALLVGVRKGAEASG
jgi:hypothetical protein